MHARVSIDTTLLRRMYVDERLTTTEIGRRLGCGASTVTRRLRAAGTAVRPRGPNPDRYPLRFRARAWSPEIAWVVGLIATDGNLASTGHGMSITSKDLDLLESARRCLGLSNRFARVSSAWGTGGYRLQWRHRAFYDWLVALGLTPRKSLTLGALDVPDEHFADFFRGCIDGDGTVLVYTDRHHTIREPLYVYTRLYVSLVSASRTFIDWIRATVYRLLRLPGTIHVKWTSRQRPVWTLRYSKKASIRLLGWMYYSPDVPCLARKRAKAEPFMIAVK
jgi:hypothetical protein